MHNDKFADVKITANIAVDSKNGRMNAEIDEHTNIEKLLRRVTVGV